MCDKLQLEILKQTIFFAIKNKVKNRQIQDILNNS